MWLKIALPLFFLFGQHCLCEAHIETHTKNPRVLLISFDGFRWDYVELAHREGRKTPNFDSLIQNGVKAKWVKNVFATKTFPNHYTLVTGMYEESHGVVGNEMYDPVFNETFKMNNFSQECDPKWWNNGTKGGGGEPIWVTNQKDEQSLERRWSGVMFWPGSSAKVHGVHPYHYMDYDASLPNKTRIDNIVKWFSAKEDPINLGLLYFSEPDGLGHSKGPESLQMIDMIVALDRLVGYLIEQLKAYSLFESINIIITSDHGMAQIKSSIKIDDTVNSSMYKVYGSSPIWNIMPSDGLQEEVYEKLKKIKHLTVYRKEDIPEKFHYKHNRRVLPILIAADEGYSLCDVNHLPCQEIGGNHGFSNDFKSMHPFFIAHGPVFKRGYISEPFNSVDVYPLICKILNIQPAPNNGSLDNIQHILKLIEHKHGPRQLFGFTVTAVTFLLVVLFAAMMSGICCIAACRVQRIHTHHLHPHLVKLGSVHFGGNMRLLTTDDDEDDYEEEIP